MNLSQLQKLYNRKSIITHKKNMLKLHREKKKRDKTNHRYQLQRKKWQDKRDYASNKIVLSRFLDKNFIINV